MKVGDLVKTKLNKVGIIIYENKRFGTMYGVFIDGEVYAQHETDLEVICK